MIIDTRRYLDLDNIARNGALETVQLSNIVPTATTLLTVDGYAIYTKRSDRVSTGQREFTSAVAENIHRHKDIFDIDKSHDDLPIPFRTVLRGIKEEISPQLTKSVNPDAIFLLGICFDLKLFVPALLFLVVLPVTLADFWELCRNYKGIDFHEGDLEAVRPLPDEPGLVDILSSSSWIPSGQASLIRTVQFLQAILNESGQRFSSIVQKLSNGNNPST